MKEMNLQANHSWIRAKRTEVMAVKKGHALDS